MKKTKYSISSVKAAELFNVNVSTIKRWSDSGILKCQKTAGGHRKFSIEDIKNYSNEVKLALPELALTKLSKAVISNVSGNKTERLAKHLQTLLLKGDSDNADTFLYNLYLNNYSLQEIFDEIIAACMKDIGDKWLNKTINIEDEHIASKALTGALYSLERRITALKSNGKKAICVCLENEYHEIGLLCVKIILSNLGWKVIYPGSDLPLNSLMDLIEKEKPDIVCISIKKSYIDTKLTELIKLSEKYGIKFIGGGNPKLRSLNGFEYCGSTNDLISFIN